MAPKKKTITAIGSSGAERPVPVRAGSGPVADRTRAAAHEHQHRSGSQSLASGVVRTPNDEPHTAKSKTGLGRPQAARGPPGVSLCPLRAVQRPPRCPPRRPQCVLPMVCATSSVTTPVTLDTAVGRALHIICGTKEASMPAEVLARMARSRWAVIELLLTWLEVEARHGPRSFRHYPRQQKLWRACSCSSTSLLL